MFCGEAKCGMCVFLVFLPLHDLKVYGSYLICVLFTS